MNIVVVEAQGVLYPPDKAPPAADPVISGITTVKCILEGLSKASPVVVHDGLIDQAHLREWCALYGLTSVMVLSRDPGGDGGSLWGEKILTWIANRRSNPAIAIVTSAPATSVFTEIGVPALRLYPPLGTLPDWGPAASNWSNPAVEEE